MIRAVEQRCAQTDHRIAGEHAVLHGLADALVDSRMEVLRNRTAEDLFLEQIIALCIRRELHLDVTVLAVAAGLLLVLAFDDDRLADLFAVRYDRSGQRDFYAELVPELGAQNVQLNIAGTGDEVLLGLGVEFGLEGRVLVMQTGQTCGDLLLGALDLGGDRLRVAGRRELDRLELDLAHAHGQGVARPGRDQLGDRADVAAADDRDLGRLFAANGEDVTHLLVRVRALVDERHILLDLAGHDLEVGEAAVLVSDRLEYKCTGRTVRCAVDLDQLALFVLAQFYRLLVRGRHVVRDALEQRVGADAGRSSAAEYRREDQILDALTDAGDQLFIRELLACEIALHQILGQLRDVLAQRRAVLVDAVLHVLGDRDLDALVAVHAVGLADNAVDDADGVAVALEDRDNDRRYRYAELLLQLVQRGIVIRVFLVDFRDVEHARHCLLLAALPRLFRADARAGLAGRDDQSGLCNAHRALHFAFKIKEARGIEQVDLAVVPFYGRYCGRDRELAADFFGVEIADRVAVGDLAYAVGRTGDIKQALDERGLAVAAVAHETYVTDLVYRIIGHN